MKIFVLMYLYMDELLGIGLKFDLKCSKSFVLYFGIEISE